MKKILFVMNTMGRAGAERALLALIKNLPKEEYDISLYVLINRGELFDEVPDYVHILNKKPDNRSVLSFSGRLAIIHTVLRCFFRHASGFRLIGYFFKNLKIQLCAHRLLPDKLLWRTIANGSVKLQDTYDLAVAYIEGASTYYIAERIQAKKKAAFVHIDYQKAGYNKTVDLDAYQKIDRVFAVSKEARESFLRVYPEYNKKTFLFRNLHDTNRIASLAKKPLPDNSAFVKSSACYKLLTVGRLNYQKAYDIAIDALAILRKRNIDADWFVLGEGSLQKELTRQIAKKGLSDHFFLLGSTNNPYPYYRAATIYVHATRFEGKSIAIEEAQLLSKAIVASDCTGNREQIQSGTNGILVTLTPEAVANGIETLLANPFLIQKYEQAGRQTLLTHPKDMDAFLELLE